MNAPSGTLIAYATAPGSTASDGSGKNSPYTNAILENIEIPNITITQMFQNVGRLLIQHTNKQQIPWISSSLTGDFYFVSIENLAQITPTEEKNTAPVNKANAVNEKTISLEESVLKSSSVLDTVKLLVDTNSFKQTLRKEVTDSAYFPLIDFFMDNRDNYRYKTIKVGDQIWMAENLRTTKLNDGTHIPVIYDKNNWSTLKTFACCWYDNNESIYNNYGVLYNWHTVATGKLCPKEWHVPTDAEWVTFINYLGGNESGGGKLKEPGELHWKSPNADATDSYSFSALPGGARFRNGLFDFVGSIGAWWSSTEQSNDYAFYRGVYYNFSVINKDYENKNAGFSVRCIKDSKTGN
jgi:uncharacterized protein (TIGR02145 family)